MRFRNQCPEVIATNMLRFRNQHTEVIATNMLRFRNHTKMFSTTNKWNLWRLPWWPCCWCWALRPMHKRKYSRSIKTAKVLPRYTSLNSSRTWNSSSKTKQSLSHIHCLHASTLPLADGRGVYFLSTLSCMCWIELLSLPHKIISQAS